MLKVGAKYFQKGLYFVTDTGLISRYFNWLQQDNPTGTVERYPEIDAGYASSVKGVYIVGDLTGIPLLKFAAETGTRIIQQFLKDENFKQERAAKEGGVQDILVIGAGPAGVAAGIACEKNNLDYLVLETSKLFNTIENFPKGKPILAKPDDYQQQSDLRIRDGDKESLLEELKEQISKYNLNIQTESVAREFKQTGNYLEVTTNRETYRTLRVVLAIGKSGNYRKLGVPGEELEHVSNKLYDPTDFVGKQILVVGGGDTAIETSVALAKSGNHIVHTYRKDKFDRPKEENLAEFNERVKKQQIEPLFASTVKKIEPTNVTLLTQNGEQVRPVDQIFTMIGREPPLGFFKRNHIKMEGERDFSWMVYLTAMLSFFTMLYFGKSGVAVNLFKESTGIGSSIVAYLTGPFQVKLSWSVNGYAWYSALNFYLGWLGSLVFLVSGSAALVCMWKNHEKYFSSTWSKIKYSYLTGAAVLFTVVYFTKVLGKDAGWVEEPTYWYSLLYCTTMALFAVRRVWVKKTRYILYQMITLVFIQVFFLFLLPFHIFDSFIRPNFAPDSYVLSQMFPNGKWSSFGFILFWPLNMGDFGTSTFWTWFPIVQTFGFLFFLVYKFGKGAYCGWICSCGGMAESLGDEYRTKAPHGPAAKKLDNIGQGVLVFAILVTLVGYFGKYVPAAGILVDTFKGSYKLLIDVFFAGVLGLGVYFFLGGRVWCRFGCPLAALMHIYNRIGVYRILAEKKKCISCNICTKVCHMGIDVMNYANKGIPMNDTECVRCSACVQSCPTEVLAFGQTESDMDNKSRKSLPSYGKEDWRSGII